MDMVYTRTWPHKLYACNKGTRVMPRRTDMVKHLASHLTWTNKCKVWYKACGSRHALLSHYHNQHLVKKHSCEDGEKIYNHSKALRNHYHNNHRGP